MSCIKELAEILPQIIIYIVTGYVFLKTFHFVALKQNEMDVEHILTTSLVIGYVFWSIAYIIPFSISYEIDAIGIVLSALVLGYIFGRIIRSKQVIKLLDLLKIRDTGNKYFWDDLMDDTYAMKAKISYENMIYEGMLHNYESYSNDPHIVLGAYVIKNSEGKAVKNYSEDNSRIIILNISNAISVEVIYDKESKECCDLKYLCDANKRFEKEK